MNKQFVKHLVAALVGVLAAYIGAASPINFAYIGIFSLGYVLVYTAKNFVFPSKSPLGFIDVWDLVSGLVLAVGAALSDLAAQWITVKTIDWHILWVTVSSAAVAYLLSKFGFGKKK